MDANNTYQQVDALLEELSFYKDLLSSLPAIVYINEIQECGNPLSCRNIWSNKVALDYIGCTQEEITAMGYDFFVKYLHPDDLDVIPQAMGIMPQIKLNPVFVGMSRLRTKSNPKYHWTYGFGSVLETYADGSFRKMLSAVFVVSDEIHCEKQFHTLLKEVNQLKYQLKLSTLSSREKQVLHLITKGKTDKEIAQELYISFKTSKKHRNNIQKKLHLHNSAGLAAFAVESGEC